MIDMSTFMPRVIRLRARSDSCRICSDSPDAMTFRSTLIALLDTTSSARAPAEYVEWCTDLMHDRPQIGDEAKSVKHVTVAEFSKALLADEPIVCVDVRQDVQWQCCALPRTVHIPLQQLQKRISDIESAIGQSSNPTVYTLCRRGVDSQHAAAIISAQHPDWRVFNVRGGLNAWQRDIDPDFPLY